MVYGSTPLTATVLGWINRINSGMYALGGVNWPQFQLRFDGPTIKTEYLGVYTIYNVDWHFTVRRDGWWREVNQNNTQIQHEQMYPTAALTIPTGWAP